jgi:hypothetical protein
MGFSSRRAMMSVIYTLTGVIVIEVLILCSLIIVVPDLPRRIQRINTVPDGQCATRPPTTRDS